MDLFVLRTWIRAKINADSERGAGMVGYGLLVALSAVIAIVAVPAHPLLPHPFTAAISIVGLLAWSFCAVIVAGAPA